MGGFLIVNNSSNMALETIEQQFKTSIDVFYEKGMTLNQRIVTSGYVIYLFNKIKSSYKNIVVFDNDDFVINTGTMFYKQKIGESALRELYEDFSINNQLFFNNLLGNYCVIIAKGNNLFLFNSYSGVYRVYAEQSKNIISSSFLSVYKALDKKSIRSQELFEYLCDGTFYGENTLIEEIKLINNENIVQLSPVISSIPKQLKFDCLDANDSFDDMISNLKEDLLEYFKIVKYNFGNDVCAALSAGSDTRLMLACMRNIGINPYLYVYGNKNDNNVRTARMIADSEGFKIDIEERSKFPIINPDEYPDQLKKHFYIVDGLGTVGVFDNGSDLITRLKRIERGQLQLNGAGDIGTLYYSWPDKNISIKSLLKIKFDRGDYSMFFVSRFSKNQYFSTLRNKIINILNLEDDIITREQLETLLQKLRVKYWTGNPQMISNQFADALVPFCEPRLMVKSLSIPFKYKYLTVFKAAIIKAIDPEIAKYISPQYGYKFSDYEKVPLKRKLKDYCKYHAPASLRPYIRAHFWRQENKQIFPYYLTKKYLDTIFPNSDKVVSEYIDIGKITDPDMLSRALSLELLLSDRF